MAVKPAILTTRPPGNSHFLIFVLIFRVDNIVSHMIQDLKHEHMTETTIVEALASLLIQENICIYFNTGSPNYLPKYAISIYSPTSQSNRASFPSALPIHILVTFGF